MGRSGARSRQTGSQTDRQGKAGRQAGELLPEPHWLRTKKETPLVTNVWPQPDRRKPGPRLGGLEVAAAPPRDTIEKYISIFRRFRAGMLKRCSLLRNQQRRYSIAIEDSRRLASLSLSLSQGPCQSLGALTSVASGSLDRDSSRRIRWPVLTTAVVVESPSQHGLILALAQAETAFSGGAPSARAQEGARPARSTRAVRRRRGGAISGCRLHPALRRTAEPRTKAI